MGAREGIGGHKGANLYFERAERALAGRAPRRAAGAEPAAKRGEQAGGVAAGAGGEAPRAAVRAV